MPKVRSKSEASPYDFPGARVDGVALLLVADSGGGHDDVVQAGVTGGLTDEVFGHGGTADVSGANGHDAIHAVHVTGPTPPRGAVGSSPGERTLDHGPVVES
jgi:hypothetical protein